VVWRVCLKELPVLRRRKYIGVRRSHIVARSEWKRDMSPLLSPYTVPTVWSAHTALPLYLGHHTPPSKSCQLAACGISACQGGVPRSTPSIQKAG
jgi:hypothetical protein